MRSKSEPDRPERPEREPAGPHALEVSGEAVPETAPRPALAPAPAPSAPVAPRRRGGSRGLRLLLVLILIAAGSLAYGGYWWVFLRGTVSTDDAYVDSRIVSVASRLSERMAAVLVKEGDPVKAGQVLARFADDKLRIAVDEAQASVRAAAAALEEARNTPRPEEVQVARAEVRVQEVELELQQKEWERAQQLARVHAVSAQELERRRSAVASAQSQLEVGRRKLSLLMAGRSTESIQRGEADLALARTRLQAAQADLGDAEVHAPLTGIVARQMIDPGEVAQKGQALFQVVDSNNTWVVANLEEDAISHIHEGQPVRIWVDAYPGREFAGRVGPLYAATLSRFSLLPSSSASGSFIKVTQRVPVRIDWDEKALPLVYPGLNVVVRITVDRP